MTTTDDQKTRDEQWVYLAQWLNLSLGEKEWRGLPLTEQELVDMWGVGSTRTLRNWKEKPEFQTLRDRYRSKKLNELHRLPLLSLKEKARLAGTEPEEPEEPETVTPVAGATAPAPVSVDSTGDPVMDMIREKALNGDGPAQAKYMQYFGRVRAEQSAKAAGIPYETVELKRMLVENWAAIGEEHLVNIMNELGYSVLPREDKS